MSKTIPIVPASASKPQRGRSMPVRRLHQGIAGAIAVAPPLWVAAYYLEQFLHSPEPLMSSIASLTVFVVALMVTAARGVACIPGSLSQFLLTAGVGAIATAFGAGASAIAAALLITGAALLASLGAAKLVFGVLRKGRDKQLTNEDRALLNKKCNTCVAASFCPYQPGAFADQYKKQ